MKRRKKLRVLLLMHQDLVPPDSVKGLTREEMAPFKTELDVMRGLQELGHEVMPTGLGDELLPLRHALRDWQPHITFNLMEEFRQITTFDHAVVSYLELMRQPYTGCNPRGLILARDKALSKKILHYHRIHAPAFMVVLRGRKPRRKRGLEFPLIVKSLVEEASLGISQASVVHNEEKLAERVEFIHRTLATDAIVERYIRGREVYCTVLGNQRLEALPVWELFIENLPAGAPRIATQKVKWDFEYQEKIGVKIGAAELTQEQIELLHKRSKQIYRRIGMSGYGRMDFRLAENGDLYFLEANPNADIGIDEEMASAAKQAGYSYPELIQRILRLGLAAARVSA